jgi:hypothetical protein
MKYIDAGIVQKIIPNDGYYFVKNLNCLTVEGYKNCNSCTYSAMA